MMNRFMGGPGGMGMQMQPNAQFGDFNSNAFSGMKSGGMGPSAPPMGPSSGTPVPMDNGGFGGQTIGPGMNWGMAMMQSPTSPYNMQQNMRDLQAQLENAQIRGDDPFTIADLQRQLGWAQQDYGNQANQQMARFAQQHSGNMVGGGSYGPDPYLMQIMRSMWGGNSLGGSAAGMHPGNALGSY